MRTIVYPISKKEESVEVEVKNPGVKCAFEGCTLPAYGERKFCTKKHSFKNRPRSAKASKAKSSVQLVEIGGEKKGSADSLLNALDKMDAAAAPELVRIEMHLSQMEIDRILDRLDDVQRVAFIAAGLRAALLA